jgi:HlyD family secretion protein
MLKNLWVKRALVALAAVAVAIVGWRLIRGGDEPKVTFELAKIDRGTVERSVSSTGSVAALVTVEIGSQISGQIAELHADFNTQVKKGDLLAVIDAQTYRSRVASAEADMAVARATQGTQQANLNKARTSLAQAERDYKRQQTLAEQQLISISEIEGGRKAMELASGDVEIAQAQLKNATAALQTRQASLDQARIDLSRTQIRSPIDGIVIQRSIDLGQTVAASLQAPVLFKIAQDMSQIQIEAKVDEADIGAINAGDAATFTVDAFPDQNFQGRVAQVRLAATTSQNVVTYSVMVQAQNPRQMLLPGMTANVRIVTSRRDDVLRVPNDAARFQPVGSTPAANVQGPGGFAGGGGPGGPGGPGGFQAEMMKELGLTKEQEAKLEKAREELFSQMRSQTQGSGPGALGGGFPGGPGGPGGFNNNQGQAMRNRFDNMMSSVLTPEQMDKFRKLREQRSAGAAETRRGMLWTLEKGVPKGHEVRFGVADDRFTELVESDLKEGDEVIVRSRTEVRK